MAFKSFKDESKFDAYGRDFCGDKSQFATLPELTVGAMLRIADAIEKMAGNYSAIIEERDRYKRYLEEERTRGKRAWHRIAGLKGTIARIKKQTKKG